MPTIEQIKELLPLLIPIIILQYGLMIAALIDVIKREKTKGPKGVWIAVIILVNLIGPILYFLIGRDE